MHGDHVGHSSGLLRSQHQDRFTYNFGVDPSTISTSLLRSSTAYTSHLIDSRGRLAIDLDLIILICTGRKLESRSI